MAQEATGVGNGSVGWLSPKDERFAARFQQLLLEVPTNLDAGWQLAADLGRPAVPLLWDLLHVEKSNVGRRLVVLTAAVLAGGPNEDERLFAWLDQQKPMPQERVLAAVLLALGPKRQRAMPGFWSKCFGPSKTPEQILGIAVRLAAARFPGSEEGAPTLMEDDPGLAAATAYAGLPVPAGIATKLWNLRTPERHAELFWRGAMLGGARQRSAGAAGQDMLLDKSRELMALRGDQVSAARASAALYRARARDFRVDGTSTTLDWSLLQLAAAETANAVALQAWLGPAAHPRAEDPQRLAVSYVLSRDPQIVVDERLVWSAEVRIRKHVATALAVRLLAEDQPRRIDALLPGVPEWNFVRWATGVAMDHGVSLDDPQLQAAAELAAAGRLPRLVLRSVLEEALWRWGSHPGLGMWENERLLLRDLLLVGSNEGGGKYQPHVKEHERYRPQRIGADNLFAVAVALYDFLSRPRLPMPPEYRLR